MKLPALPRLVLACLCAPLALLHAAPATEVKLTRLADRVRVEIGGQLFTEYIFAGTPKPYLYPVLASDGTQLNRDFPLKKDTAGEETDHPHHRSLWFTHGAVNGIDFWSDGKGKGLTVHDKLIETTSGAVGVLKAGNRWIGPDEKVACTDETTIRFRAVPDGRVLDYEVTIKAPADKPVVFGDTKEGAMAMRLAQWMTIAHKYQKKDSGTSGHIVNDSGIRDGATWGKRSEWVDYFSAHNGKTYGVAMFDHPKNPQHPTWWHVRDYGLFAANPFGQHDFEGTKEKPLPATSGDLTIPAGGSVTFRYRFFFHYGDEKAGKVAERFADYAAGK